MVDLKKSSNLIGWEHFGLYLKNKIFPKNRICAGTQQIISIFITEQIPYKSMTKLFLQFKKPYFWHVSLILGAKKLFPKIFGSVMYSLIRVSTTVLKFRKTYWYNSKRTSRQMAGHQDGQTLFHRTIPAAAGSPTSTTRVHWHFKLNDMEDNVSLIINYWIKVSMQRINSIHKLILKILQILGSHELNGHGHFWSHPPYNYWNTI